MAESMWEVPQREKQSVFCTDWIFTDRYYFQSPRMDWLRDPTYMNWPKEYECTGNSHILNSLPMIFWDFFLGEHLVFKDDQFLEPATWLLRAHFLVHQLIRIIYEENMQVQWTKCLCAPKFIWGRSNSQCDGIKRWSQQQVIRFR